MVQFPVQRHGQWDESPLFLPEIYDFVHEEQDHFGWGASCAAIFYSKDHQFTILSGCLIDVSWIQQFMIGHEGNNIDSYNPQQ
jgi:hypothetical protein